MSKKCIILIVTSIIAVMALPLGFPWLTCGLYIGIILYFAYLNNEYTVICFLSLAIFQNIILIIFSKYISDVYMVVLLAIKELLIYCSILRGMYQIVKDKKLKELLCKNKLNIIILCVFFCFTLINSFNTTAGFKSVIFSIRQMCIPIACFLMGYFLHESNKGFDKIKKVVVALSLFVVIFGVIEMILPENVLWQKLQYGVFLNKKQQSEVILYKGVTGNFYTWDLGFKLRRLVSITADPLATSHIIIIGLFTLVFLRKSNSTKLNRSYILATVLLIVGSILAVSKGVVVYLLLLVVGGVYHKYLKDASIKKVLVFIGSIFMITIIVVCALYFTATHPTAITNHIDGLINGIKGSSFLGNGMGTVGAANNAITGANISNSESYMGVCLNQIGYIGMSALIILWIRLVICNIKTYLKNKNKENMFMLVLLIGLTVDMILSESSVSILGTGIYFIYIGIIEKNKALIIE